MGERASACGIFPEKHSSVGLRAASVFQKGIQGLVTILLAEGGTIRGTDVLELINRS